MRGTKSIVEVVAAGDFYMLGGRSLGRRQLRRLQ